MLIIISFLPNVPKSTPRFSLPPSTLSRSLRLAKLVCSLVRTHLSCHRNLVQLWTFEATGLVGARGTKHRRIVEENHCDLCWVWWLHYGHVEVLCVLETDIEEFMSLKSGDGCMGIHSTISSIMVYAWNFPQDFSFLVGATDQNQGPSKYL